MARCARAVPNAVDSSLFGVVLLEVVNVGGTTSSILVMVVESYDCVGVGVVEAAVSQSLLVVNLMS